MENRHLIFISHASEDRNVAYRTVDALESEDIKCWIAPRDISGGERFVNSIMDAIRQCELFIVLISRNSNRAPYVKSETASAFENNKRLLPIRIEDVEPDEELRFYIGGHHWIESWNKPSEIYLFDIVKEVNNLLYYERDIIIDSG
ncbi:MAG: toll/interleukin-1 receptor domain-containing protein, partial [Candidatus Hodarchaeales archaeon]